MKQLWLMRHAKSSWEHAELDDFSRPLNRRGNRVAPLMGRWLSMQESGIDTVVSSTAVRAQQTASHVLAHLPSGTTLESTGALYLATVSQWVDEVRRFDNCRNVVLAIGHNPGMEDLLAEVADAGIPFPTAAITLLTLKIEHWSQFSLSTETVKMQGIWRPKELFRDCGEE
ncbi:MAG: histidine phosphatase family protein [Planctomycetaceae bacterium]